MNAVLFVGHGSKKDEGNREVSALTDRLKADVDADICETCFLEFANPTVHEGIDRCVAQGATTVAVIPVMFFSAGHSKLHIPQEIDEAKKRHPGVCFLYGRPVGIHHQLFDLFDQQLKGLGFHDRDERCHSAVLLVGRGSSDPDANSDLYKMARLLSERLNGAVVETSFIGVTYPTVEEGVDRCIRLGAMEVFIMPYFFFTGILMDRMGDKLDAFRKMYPEHRFFMSNYVGFHPAIADILIERVNETFAGRAKLNCDMCEYRLHALEHMDIHHHHDHGHGHVHS